VWSNETKIPRLIAECGFAALPELRVRRCPPLRRRGLAASQVGAHAAFRSSRKREPTRNDTKGDRVFTHALILQRDFALEQAAGQFHVAQPPPAVCAPRVRRRTTGEACPPKEGRLSHIRVLVPDFCALTPNSFGPLSAGSLPVQKSRCSTNNGGGRKSTLGCSKFSRTTVHTVIISILC